MRFAWLRSSDGSGPPPTTGVTRILLIGYNLVWWVPIALPILGLVTYRAGAIGFLILSMARAAVNLYRNNVLPVDEGDRFPLRLP